MLYLTSHSMWCLWTEAILGIGPLPPRGLHVHDNGIQDHVVAKAIGQTRFVYVTAQHAGSVFCHVHFEWTLAALSAPQILDMVEAFEASSQCRFFLVLSLLPKNPLGESLPWCQFPLCGMPQAYFLAILSMVTSEMPYACKLWWKNCGFFICQWCKSTSTSPGVTITTCHS
jgi:hypothetical protein